MERRLDVVGLGYCAYDILAITPGLPEFDAVDVIHAAEMTTDGGGPVGTALTALARLGMRTGYIGVLGDDQEGRYLCDLFAQTGVDTSRLRKRGDVGTNICLLLVEQVSGRRAILCHQRVHSEDLSLNMDDRAYIQSARVLHVDGQFMPAALQAARWAKEAGVKVCFDGNHPRPGLSDLLPLVDWLVVSESFPQSYTELTNLERAARALLSAGGEVLVVTEGERGCRLWTARDHLHVPGFQVEAVDTTGAGDAFHGAFIYAMLQDWDLRCVVTFANAVAAINCQTLGGRRGLPTLTQVENFIQERQR